MSAVSFSSVSTLTPAGQAAQQAAAALAATATLAAAGVAVRPMTLSGSVTANLVLDELLANGLESGSSGLAEAPLQAFTAGTAVSQCDQKWSKSSTLAPGAWDTWVLSALVDDFNRPVALARFNILLISSGATVAGDDLTVGGAATHPLTSLPTFVVRSLGFELKVGMNTTGFVVSAGTADQLKILNSGANPITYRIALVGRSV